MVLPDLDGTGQMAILIQLQSGKGTKLSVCISSDKPVTPAIVRKRILEAVQGGWDPESKSVRTKRKTATALSSAVKRPLVSREAGYPCPICGTPALQFIRDGYFACGGCQRTYMPDELRGRLKS